MIYEFLDIDGKLVELTYSMKEVPSIGCIINLDGKELKRVASNSVQVDPATNRPQYPYVSACLPRNLSGCKTQGGKPIVESKRHEREIMARHGYVKD